MRQSSSCAETSWGDDLLRILAEARQKNRVDSLTATECVCPCLFNIRESGGGMEQQSSFSLLALSFSLEKPAGKGKSW